MIVKNCACGLALLALIAAFPGSVQAQNGISVRISGGLEIYEVSGPVKWEEAARYRVQFSPGDPDLLSIPGEVGVDRYFRWLALGTLHRQIPVQVTITAAHEGFVLYDPPRSMEVSPHNSRLTNILIKLKTPERAKRDAFANGNNALQGLGALGPRHATANEVQLALRWYERALGFVRDPTVLSAKANLLHKVGRFSECSESYSELIDLQNTLNASREMLGIAWYGRIACLRSAADIAQTKQAWKDLIQACRQALDSDLPSFYKPRFLANWLDALLVLSDSRGDFRRFAHKVVSDSSVRGEWLSLYYHAFKGIQAPPDVGVEEVVGGAIDLSRTLGRPY